VQSPLRGIVPLAQAMVRTWYAGEGAQRAGGLMGSFAFWAVFCAVNSQELVFFSVFKYSLFKAISLLILYLNLNQWDNLIG
jgi:hypothetical protein